MPKSRLARAVAIVSVSLILAIGALVVWRLLEARRDGGMASAALIGGPFSLTDQNGNRRSNTEFRGQLLLVYFGFTFCPDLCPTALQTMGRAIDALGASGARVTPLFITVDPARDTVTQLKSYAANFHPRLVALTGTEAEIATAAEAYRIYYQKVEDKAANGYSLDHSSVVYLMGPDGAFLTHFPAGTTAEQMAEKIRSYL